MSKLSTACPKPRHRKKSTPKGIAKVSKKRASQSDAPRYSTISGPRKAIKPKRRKPSEMLRIYGPPERRAWIKQSPCFVCVSLLPILRGSDHRWACDNAHTISGGKGRKADAKEIVPLCRAHHRMYDDHEGFLADPRLREIIRGAAQHYEAAWQSRAVSGFGKEERT